MECLRRRKDRPRAFILTEACVSLALAGLVLFVVSLLMVQHARATNHCLNHRRAQLATESCVERMRVHTLKVADADFKDEAGVAYEIRVVETDEAWRPLVRVRVTAIVGGSGGSGRAARYTLNTYLDPVVRSNGDGP